MIADDDFDSYKSASISVTKDTTISLIVDSMRESVIYFKKYLQANYHLEKKLNEDELTQIYVEETQKVLRRLDLPFNVSCQYRDIYKKSSGVSDFYYYTNEQGHSNISIFSVESKRLPTPEKRREREYVIGQTNNGGIERYKFERHGKELQVAGILGFIEIESPTFWLSKINGWIVEVAKNNEFWSNAETLKNLEFQRDYCISQSVALRKKGHIDLFHFWIVLVSTEC